VETTTVRAELPIRLVAQMESLIDDGWFQNINDLIVDALRRFLETHRSELMEGYIWQDVEWGLRGKD
jgi:Arc/MetJ-type ribon-helix-helix transcriptional regulator